MIEIKDYTCSYDERTVLDRVTIDIEKGERVGLIGLNGSGKSTLLKSLVGIVTADKGSILIDGQVVKQKHLKVIRQKVGYIFQNADDQMFMPTVEEEVGFGLRQSLSLDLIKGHVSDILENLSLSHLSQRPPFLLSGGEKKMVTIASILVMAPDIVLLDEPTEGLDKKHQKKVIQMIQDMSQTLLVCSHDYELIRQICDRIIVIKEGKVIRDGSVEAVLGDQAFLLAHELI